MKNLLLFLGIACSVLTGCSPEAPVKLLPHTEEHSVAAPTLKQEQTAAIPDLPIESLSKENPWRYDTDIDKMNGKTTQHAAITAENTFQFKFPYSGGIYSYLRLRQRSKDGLSVMLSISSGQFLCVQGCTINVRFDDKQAMKFRGSTPDDYSSTTLFLSPETKFLAELKRAKKVLVEATYYSEGSRISEFNTEGLVWEPKKK